MTESRLIHDFPRLAKESGFYFHFRSKRVEWEEIGKQLPEVPIQLQATND